jgi:serine/threonine protein phosphatase PrpC
VTGSIIAESSFINKRYNPSNGARKLFCAHLGDARAVLWRCGAAVRLTSMSDHKADDSLEAAEVRRRGGRNIVAYSRRRRCDGEEVGNSIYWWSI